MKRVVPSYYKKFSCVGSECKHNCCIGWEIDIDDDTLKAYDKVGGELGKRLQRNIDRCADAPHFILDDNDRCPFLNSDNLCDIIIEAGKEHLCMICSAHPRFKNYFSDRVEIGIGLSCEAAAKIILTDKELFRLETSMDDEKADTLTDYERELLELRDTFLMIVGDISIPIDDRAENILCMTGAYLPDITIGTIAKKFITLEIMSDEWREKLIFVEENDTPLSFDGYEDEAQRLIIYFIYRYLASEEYDGRTESVTAFCILSAKIIVTLCRIFAKSLDDVIDICRLYSTEIEYSTDNVEALIKYIEDNYE